MPLFPARQVPLYPASADRDGSDVRLSASGEWTIWPYRCAADSLDDDRMAHAGLAFEADR